MVIICEVIVFRLVASLPFCLYYFIKVVPYQESTDPYYLQEEYKHSLYRYLGEFLNQSSLRIAVLINITRWLMVLISKLRVPQSRKVLYEKIALGAMWVLILIQLILTGLERFFKKDESFELVLWIWSKYIIVAIPIICYPLLYYKLRKGYLALIEQQRECL